MTRRVVDAEGRIQCRICGTFKDESQMKPRYKNGHRSGVRLECKSCFELKWGSNANGRRDYARERIRRADYLRAWGRATTELIRLHNEEFLTLVRRYQIEESGYELVGYREVRAHLRGVFAKPVDSR